MLADHAYTPKMRIQYRQPASAYPYQIDISNWSEYWQIGLIWTDVFPIQKTNHIYLHYEIMKTIMFLKKIIQ